MGQLSVPTTSTKQTRKWCGVKSLRFIDNSLLGMDKAVWGRWGCHGLDATNKIVVLATRVMSLNSKWEGTFYSLQQRVLLLFDKYTATLQDACSYSTLIHYQHEIPHQFRVQRRLAGMQTSNTLTIDMAKAHVLNHCIGNWLGSVFYIQYRLGM